MNDGWRSRVVMTVSYTHLTLPTRFKVDIQVTPGTHASEAAVNKQLNDKERVAAALENDNLLGVVNKCLLGADVG